MRRAVVAAGHADVWDSGRVASARSVDVPYAGPAPRSQTRYHWRVRVWDAQGRASAWSTPSYFETGLAAGDWTASWVGSPATVPSLTGAAGSGAPRATRP